jgi:hypothetical protein
MGARSDRGLILSRANQLTCFVAQFARADKSDVGVKTARQELLLHAEAIFVAAGFCATFCDEEEESSRIGKLDVFSPASALFTSAIVRVVDTPKSESGTPAIPQNPARSRDLSWEDMDEDTSIIP